MPPVYIYALCEPDTGEVRYVGVTIHPERRLAEHVSEASTQYAREQWMKERWPEVGNRDRLPPRLFWLVSLVEQGKRPIQRILEESVELERYDAERKWIDFYQHQGAPLTNVS